MNIRKPEEGVEAVRLTEKNLPDAAKFCLGSLHQEHSFIVVATKTGREPAYVGNWILKNKAGHFEVLTDYGYRKLY